MRGSGKISGRGGKFAEGIGTPGFRALKLIFTKLLTPNQSNLSSSSVMLAAWPIHHEYALKELIGNWKGSKLEEGESIVRISAVGSGMPFTKGTAGKIFRALANQKINIEMIATSEIRTTCIISEKYGEKALNEIHSCFKLGKNES